MPEHDLRGTAVAPVRRLLLHQELQSMGIFVSSKTPLNRLSYLLEQRAKLGMVSYDACSPRELKKFIKDRKLDQPKHRNSIEVLEEADMHPSFHKLLDLAAELRIRIYESYCSAFDTGKREQHERGIITPAITRASQQLRAETLPVFLASTRFFLNINQDARIDLMPAGLFFLHRTPTRFIPIIRRLRLEFGKFRFDVDIAKHSISMTDVTKSQVSDHKNAMDRELHLLLREHLGGMLKRIEEGSTGHCALRTADLFTIITSTATVVDQWEDE